MKLQGCWALGSLIIDNADKLAVLARAVLGGGPAGIRGTRVVQALAGRLWARGTVCAGGQKPVGGGSRRTCPACTRSGDFPVLAQRRRLSHRGGLHGSALEVIGIHFLLGSAGQREKQRSHETNEQHR